MNEQRAQEIRTRLAAATPGPWERPSERSQCEVYSTPTGLVVAGTLKAADAELIAAAPTDLADLLDEREKLLDLAETAYRLAWRIRVEGGHGYTIHDLADSVEARARAYRTATTGEAGR